MSAAIEEVADAPAPVRPRVQPWLEPVRFSNLKHMARSPAHYEAVRRSGIEETRAIQNGSLVDWLVFGDRPGEKPVVIYDGAARRGKAWAEFCAAHPTAEIYKRSEVEQAQQIADAINRHPLAKRLVQDGTKQERIEWSYCGRTCRSRPDTLGLDRVVDLKTARDVVPERFIPQARRLSYPAQLAFYREAARTVGVEARRCYIVAVETARPFDVVVYSLAEDALDLGLRSCRLWIERVLASEAAEQKMVQDLGRPLTDAEVWQCWPGYSAEPVELATREEDFELLIGGEKVAVGGEPDESDYADYEPGGAEAFRAAWEEA